MINISIGFLKKKFISSVQVFGVFSFVAIEAVEAPKVFQNCILGFPKRSYFKALTKNFKLDGVNNFTVPLRSGQLFFTTVFVRFYKLGFVFPKEQLNQIW